MKHQQPVQKTAERMAQGTWLERLGEAKIEGERRRLAKMSDAQRNRDSILQKIFWGIFAVFNALATLGFLITIFVELPACRIPLVLFLLVVFWISFRKRNK